MSVAILRFRWFDLSRFRRRRSKQFELPLVKPKPIFQQRRAEPIEAHIDGSEVRYIAVPSDRYDELVSDQVRLRSIIPAAEPEIKERRFEYEIDGDRRPIEMGYLQQSKLLEQRGLDGWQLVAREIRVEHGFIEHEFIFMREII